MFSEDIHKPKPNPTLEFFTSTPLDMTGHQLLSFLNLIKGSNPEILEKPLRYVYDGEFYSFKGIVLEDLEIRLVDNDN